MCPRRCRFLGFFSWSKRPLLVGVIVVNRVRTIVTHPGGAHKDDFLACSILVALHGVAIERREPVDADLEDAGIAVVDVGGRHEPGRQNFDHHQFAPDAEPVCALSLVLQSLDLYEDAQQFCDWMAPAEWLDSKGPEEAARWMGIERRILGSLSSPLDISLLRWFAREQEMGPGHPLWEVMRVIGEDLVSYLRRMRERMAYIDRYAVFWRLEDLESPNEILFLPRNEAVSLEPSLGLERYIEQCGRHEAVVGLVYPDRRGSGYGLSRYRGCDRLDFTRVQDQGDVHFAHARGFVAKTTATEESRLRDLLRLAAAETRKTRDSGTS